ncbi:PASTA domain-containing protein [Amycolatopsis regifaucium]|uniref:non-specific serine/threonine protein kinase n=1 Tax=Amycolatopsis regifaucium TaxID=546365 RepID=A0A154ML59_9PSEU|nr:PASTA domain-containing protein [Amycolatopsis regifaucium]KZB84607.1 serine/threonine protein kinase [Amycolatopsis regifaucium]OKA11071.1 serine/threonine protein kinase [Amycolatopsis regifaucium]
MTRTDPTLVGTLLEGRYRVDKLLARGGMSSVYRGVDTRLDRQVAIKIMDPRFADDRSFVERFEREARSAARLHHPHVVAVHDQGFDTPGGEESGRAFLVMELVDGGTLRELLAERGPLDVALALSIAEPVLSALAAAHAAGLVHRDVKPENVLIGRGGTALSGGVVKVGDFGLVRAIASAGTTSSSVILGTVAYVSPEQVATGATTSSGDVYSAGILLYEMLTGRAPYTGDTAISVAYRHVNDDVPRPSELRPGIPPALDELILRATRRDPEQRPSDAAVFLAELNHLRTILGIPSVPVPVPLPPDADRETDAERTTPGIPAVPAMNAATATTVLAPVAEATLPVTGPRGTQALHREPRFPPTPPPGTQPPRTPPPRAKPPADDEDQPRSRKRLYLMIAAAVLVLGGLIGAFAFILNDSGPTSSSVPKLAGMNQAAAGDALRSAKLTPAYTEEYSDTAAQHTVIRSDPAAGASLAPGSTVNVVLSKGRPIVPDIQAGTSQQDAETAIKAAQLTPARGEQEFSDVAKNKVIRVDPSPGSQLNIGGQVTIILSKGPEPLPPVPDVTGQSKDAAFSILQQAGFQPFQAGEEFSDQFAAGQVIRTDPKGGGKASNRRIGVFVSNAVEVPNVTFKRMEEAFQILRQAGLEPDRQGRGNGNGHGGGNGGFDFVLEQDPQPGTKVPKGSKVRIRGFG